MRTIIAHMLTCIFLFFACYLQVNSQIKVSNNNFVGINYEEVPISRFVINGPGQSGYQAYIYNPNISTSGGSLVLRSEKGTGSGTHIKTMDSTIPNGSSNYLYGIYAASYGTSAYGSGRSYGVYGLAGNSSNGFNYALYGYLYGANNGAAVFGTVGGSDIQISGKYAGYFQGNMKCSNTIYAAAFQTQSDERFKTNIVDINSTEIIVPFGLIRPVSYNLKQIDIQSEKTDTASYSKVFYESEQFFSTSRYGLIAQDLQKIFPNLVSADDNGDLSVDYLGLIPILITVIQDQELRIEKLETELKKVNEAIAAIKK